MVEYRPSRKTLEGNVIDLDRDLSMAPLKDLWMQNQQVIWVYQPIQTLRTENALFCVLLVLISQEDKRAFEILFPQKFQLKRLNLFNKIICQIICQTFSFNNFQF